MKYQAYVLFGAPGSGKGTQGQLLSEIPGFVHVSAHEVFGSLPLEQEPLGMYDGYSNRGQNMLNLVMVEMLHYHLRMLTKQGRLRPEIDTVVLDGIPTNAIQAKAICSFINVRLVFNLWLPCHDELRRRMHEHAIANGRVEEASDTAMRARLRQYVNEAMALIEYYRSVTRVVITIAEPMKVFRDILRMIKDVDGERLAKAVDNESATSRFIEEFQSTSSEGPYAVGSVYAGCRTL
jgi:adenylate kinase